VSCRANILRISLKFAAVALSACARSVPSQTPSETRPSEETAPGALFVMEEGWGADAHVEGSRLIFELWTCGPSPKRRQINVALVSHFDPLTKEQGPGVCNVQDTPDSATALPWQWEYGTSPCGFKMKVCKPLEAGTYVIYLSGASRSFEITQKGEFRWRGENRCRPWSE
jgi:hypothetical protein